MARSSVFVTNDVLMRCLCFFGRLFSAENRRGAHPCSLQRQPTKAALQRKHKAAPGLGAPWPSFCNSAFGKFGRFFWRLCVAANATQNLVFQKNAAAHNFNAALIQRGESYLNQSLSCKLFYLNPACQFGCAFSIGAWE